MSDVIDYWNGVILLPSASTIALVLATIILMQKICNKRTVGREIRWMH